MEINIPNEVYQYRRSDGRLTRADKDALLARKARYRQSHRAALAIKQRLYRIEFKEKQMPQALQIVRKFYPDVKRVVNAKKDIPVDITKGDLKAASTKDHKACAMAEACKRHLPVDGAIISTRTAYLIKGDTATRYDVPEYAAREIVSFDRGAGFTLGQYALRKPAKRAAYGKGKRKQSWDRRPGKLKHRKAKRTEGIRMALSAL